VALFGAKPEFCAVNLLAPLTAKPQVFHSAMKQACAAADDLSMAIVTGHTGAYSGLSTLVGVCTAYGRVQPEKLVTPGNAKPEDSILITKPIGLETAVNFTLMHKALARKLFGAERAEELASLVPMQSCVREALLLAELGSVHAMHDATEGGLVAALNELSEASAVGFKIEFEKLPISPEVRILQKIFKLTDEQVLSMSSTGAVLAAVKPEGKNKAVETLRQIGLTASYIGEFTRNRKRVLVKDGNQTRFPKAADDPYGRILSGKV
jgi:hydrogenase maturation factor